MTNLTSGYGDIVCSSYGRGYARRPLPPYARSPLPLDRKTAAARWRA